MNRIKNFILGNKKWIISVLIALVLIVVYICLPQSTSANKKYSYATTGVCLIVSLWFLYTLFTYNRWMNKLQRHLHWHAIGIFVLGIVLYFIGFNTSNQIGSYWNPLSLFYRSVIASLGMFISQNQLIAVSEHFKNSSAYPLTSVIYMSLFALTHFAALLVSFIFILNLFGFRVVSWWRSFSHRTIEDTYVFFGINENSLILAGNILSSLQKENSSKTGRIIFVKCGKEGNTETKSFNFLTLLGYNPIERDEVSLLHSLNALVVYGGKPLSDELVADTYRTYRKENKNIEKRKCFDIFGAAGMTTLKRFLKHTKAVSFFFLFDDSKNYQDDRLYSIESMSAIRKAKEYGDVSLKNKEVNVCFQARDTKFNSVFENIDYNPKDKKDTSEFAAHIVDEAYLSVLDLKKNSKYHPVNFIDTDTKTATVKDRFTAMIIGYSETGLEAFKFLYEYSAFINQEGREADTKIYVIDRDMDRLKHKFYEKHPALLGNRSVELIQCDTSSKTFTQTLDRLIDKLNYVVISIGDDLLAMNIASKIAELTTRQTTPRKSVLQICVRSYSNNNKYRLDEIAEYYNNLKVIGDKYLMANIFVFGKNDQIYTNSNIIADDDKQRAEKFDNAYYTEYKILNEKNKDNKYIAKFIKPKEGTLEYKNKEHYNAYQNKSNNWHISTKLALIGVNKDSVNELEHYINEYADFNKDYDNISTYQLDEKYTWISNLAKCEHVRWVRAGEMLGYQRGEASDEDVMYDKDYINKRMGCMRTCEEMSDYKVIENTIRFDYPVIKVSLDIAEEDINDKNK